MNENTEETTKTDDGQQPKSSAPTAGSVPRYCLSEIILFDNKTQKEHILGGGFNTDYLWKIQNELEDISQKVNKM